MRGKVPLACRYRGRAGAARNTDTTSRSAHIGIDAGAAFCGTSPSVCAHRGGCCECCSALGSPWQALDLRTTDHPGCFALFCSPRPDLAASVLRAYLYGWCTTTRFVIRWSPATFVALPAQSRRRNVSIVLSRAIGSTSASGCMRSPGMRT